MKLIAYVLLATLITCCTPKRSQEEKDMITMACKRAFPSVLEAYEDAMEMRVGEACRFLDRDTSIVLIPEKELYVLCGEMQMDGEMLRGCARSVTNVMYLNEELDDTALIDASAHEWFHFVLDCTQGMPDTFHLNGKVWITYGDMTAEAVALADIEFGQCL